MADFKRKRVYVAGAYSADNVVDVLRNIGRGEWYAAKIFMMGLAPFCPWHDADYVVKNWDQPLSVDMFYNYSMAWLEVSDVVFLVPGWEESKGTAAEIERARELGIPVVDSFRALRKAARRTKMLRSGG
jgi:hypothetical protein